MRLLVVDFPTVEADTVPAYLGRLTLGVGRGNGRVCNLRVPSQMDLNVVDLEVLPYSEGDRTRCGRVKWPRNRR